MMYSIKITDQAGGFIGEKPNASASDIMKLLNKNLVVIDIMTNQRLTVDMVSSGIGVSDGLITM